VAAPESWPALPLEQWDETRATLHLWMQMAGKTRLALAPMENHWWQVALHVSARGLRTPVMPAGAGRTLDLEFDFVGHTLTARTSDGLLEALPLAAQTTAAFYEHYLDLLRRLGVAVRVRPLPSEIADPIPFDQDRRHAAYDPEAGRRFGSVLGHVDRVLKEWRGWFLGKSSPVHFWWGAMDLACTRFSGRPAPLHPGGIPNLPDRVVREAYSHECMSVGWWPGGGGAPVLEPAFYAYAYGEPEGFASAAVGPAPAAYHPEMREWILPYEAVRTRPDPAAAILQFAQSAYEAAADLGGWDRKALERRAAPARATA